MKKKILGFIIGGLLMYLFYFLLSQLDFFKSARINYDKAYSAFLKNDVKGEILEVSYCDHAISVELASGDFYLLDTYTNLQGQSFIGEAKRGDSIYKIGNNYYFQLRKRNGKKYNFNIIDRTESNSFYKKY
jgi:hypothetical protein